MSFGRQPIANRFRDPSDRSPEYTFDMEVGVCPGCTLFQLIEQPAPELMFHEQYAFFSQTSVAMQAHFEAFAKDVIRRLEGRQDPFVVELGSNDGIMLRHFAGAGIRHLGIEPSANVGAEARKSGVRTLTAFFGPQTAAQVEADDGTADMILAANVMCHIPAIDDIARAASALLKPDGLLIFEEPYLGDVLRKTSYDQIYDEHVFLFSVTSVNNAFERHGLSVIHAAPQPTHGGSMRYFVGRRRHHVPSPAVATTLAAEKERGFDRPETFDAFRRSCERSRSELVHLLRELAAEGKRVVGYAATSKSTTVLNYCDIGPDLIEYISDTTPLKHGKVSPGKRIPIRPHADFQANYPEYAVLFAWNHAQEIMAKEQEYVARGGRWVSFVPTVRVLDRREPAAIT